MPQCQNCGKSEKLSACSGCSRSHYCSVECQKQDWIFHREHCISKRQPGERKSTVFEFPESADIPYNPTPRKADVTSDSQDRESTTFELFKEAVIYYNDYAEKCNEELRAITVAQILESKTLLDPEKSKIIARMHKGEKKIASLVMNRTEDSAAKIFKHVAKTLRLMGYSEESLTTTQEQQDRANLIYIETMSHYVQNITNLGNPTTIPSDEEYELVTADLPEHEKTKRLARNHARRLAEIRFPDLKDDGIKRYIVKNGKIQRIDIDQQNRIQQKVRKAMIEKSAISYSDLKKKMHSWRPKYISGNGIEELEVYEFEDLVLVPESPASAGLKRQELDRRVEKDANQSKNAIYGTFADRFPLLSHLSRKLLGNFGHAVPILVFAFFAWWMLGAITNVRATSIIDEGYVPYVNKDMISSSSKKLETYSKTTADTIEKRIELNRKLFGYVNKSEAYHKWWIQNFAEIDDLTRAWIANEQSQRTNYPEDLLEARAETVRLLFNQEQQQRRIMTLIETDISQRTSLQIKSFPEDSAIDWQQRYLIEFCAKFIPQDNMGPLLDAFKKGIKALPAGTGIQMGTVQKVKEIEKTIKQSTSTSTSIVLRTGSESPSSTPTIAQGGINWKALAGEVWGMIARLEGQKGQYGDVMARARYGDINSVLDMYVKLKESQDVQTRISALNEFNQRKLTMANARLLKQHQTLEQFIINKDPNIYKEMPIATDMNNADKWNKRFCSLLIEYIGRPEFFNHLLQRDIPLTTSIWKWQDSVMNESFKEGNLQERLQQMTQAFSTDIEEQRKRKIETAPQIDSVKNNVVTNWIWTFYYAMAKESEQRSGTDIALSLLAEVAEFIIPPQYLVNGAMLQNLASDWNNPGKILSTTAASIQAYYRMKNLAYAGAALGVFAKEVLFSGTLIDDLCSLWQYASWTQVGLGTGVITTAGFYHEHILSYGGKFLSLASKTVTLDNAARIGTLSLTLMYLAQQSQNWPSRERKTLLEKIKEVNDKYQTVDATLVDLDAIFAKELPHFQDYMVSVANAHKFAKSDAYFDAQIRQAIDTEKKTLKGDENAHKYVTDFVDAVGVDQVVFDETSTEEFIKDFEKLKAELQQKFPELNPN